MAPDERARRGITPPSAGSGEVAAVRAVDTPARPGSSPSAGGEPDPGDAAALPVDDAGRYELAGVHARGGLGRVVKAHDRRLHRTVAIKELLQRTPSAEARFVREALITARLEHPGIVPVHEAGRWPSGDPYYSMKLVSGRTLKELIHARASLDERLALVPHVLAVAEAIAYAHSQQVIHRDLKPANVIVGDFGETVVVDWGLAKDLTGALPEMEAEPAAGPAARRPGATAAGNVMGTPSYMSPEQARGGELDARTDVYSLGAILYEVLAGVPPHTGETAAEILESALGGTPRPIEDRQPGAPPDLIAIVHKAMARDAATRYPSAVELAEDIRRFQTGQLVTARHYSTRMLVRRWIARHRSLVAVAAAAALALVATGAYAVQSVVDERNRARAEQATAQAAEREAHARSQELVFLQAIGSLTHDPTAAVAWLKDYPAGGPRTGELAGILDEAEATGVARHVLRHPAWVMGVIHLGQGRALSVGMDGRVHLWDLETGRGREIARHDDGAWIAELAPGGATVAIGGQGGLIGVLPADGSGPVRTLGRQRRMVEGVSFSDDGARLLTWGQDTMRVWQIDTGEPLLALDERETLAAVIARDGRSALVAHRAGEIVRMPLAAGGTRRTVARLGEPILRLALGPDGRQLFAHGLSGAMRLIDLDTGRVRELGVQDGKVGWAAFSPSGRLLATAGVDATIRLHRLTGPAGDEEGRVLRGHGDTIYQVAFSADESFLVSASDDGTARRWDLRTGEVQVLRGHTDDVYRLALRADGLELLTASLDGSVRVWPLASRTGRTLAGDPDEIHSLGFLDDGRRVVGFGKERVLRTWDLATGEVTSEELSGRSRVTRLLAASSDLRVMAAAVKGGECAVYHRPSGRSYPLDGHRGEIRALTISGDGRWAVTGDEHGHVLEWNLSGAASEAPSSRTLFEHLPVLGVRLSAAGDRLIVGMKGRIAIHDRATGAEIAALDLVRAGAPDHTPFDAQFSPDGRLVVSPSRRGQSLLWDPASGALHRLDSEAHHTTSVEFSPDSRRLAVSMSDRTVRLVDTATGHTVTLAGHSDLVMRVAFSADSALLASASYDRTVRLWDARTGEPLRVLRGHTAAVDAVAFSPEKGVLVSLGRDGTLRLWDLEALPPQDPARVRQRLDEVTSAVIDGGRVSTPSAPAR